MRRLYCSALEIRIGETVFSYRTPSAWEVAVYLLPLEGGAPKGRRLALAENERESAAIAESPLFSQNIPIFLKIGIVNKAVSHRRQLLFHTALHRKASPWISLKTKGFSLIFYKFEEKW